MALTHAGKYFVVCVILLGVTAYWLAFRMVRRQNGGKRWSSGAAIAFWWLVCFCMVSLFFPFAYWIGEEFYVLAVSPTYEATVVSYQSAWDTCERRDSDGRTESYRCLRYTSMLEAELPDGRRVVMPSNIRSGSAPTVGETVAVVSPAGAVQWHERSLRGIGLLVGGAVMVALIGYFLSLIAAYGSGRNIERAVRGGMVVALNGLVPLGGLLMEIGFQWVLYQWWVGGNRKQLPLWVLALSLLFALALLPVLFLYAWTGLQVVLRGRTSQR